LVDISAKWNKQLYEEARRDIANVSVPKKELKKLIADKTATPGVPKRKAKIGVPDIINTSIAGTAFNVASTWKNLIVGTREEKVKSVSGLVPFDIETSTVKAPDYSATITYKPVNLPFGTVNVPNVDYGGKVTTTPDGFKQITFKATDFKTETKTDDLTQYVTNIIEYQKANVPGGSEFWGTHVIGGTDITLPSIAFPELPDIFGGLKDIGKYALIGIVGLIAIMLLTRRD